MTRFVFRSVVLLTLIGCQHSRLDTAKLYSARGLDVLAVEYLVSELSEDPENVALREITSVTLERARWQLEDDISRLSLVTSPNEVIAKWRALQDLVELSVRQGFADDAIEAERLRQESKARAQIGQSTRERLDERLSRGEPDVADLRLCREVASLDAETRPLTRTCDRLSDQLMVVAELTVGGVNAAAIDRARLAQAVEEKRLELFRLARSDGEVANANWDIVSGDWEIDEQDWFVSRRLPVHRWIERRDADGNLVKRTVVQYPTEEQVRTAKEQGLPIPQTKKVEKQVWDEVSGEYFFFESYRKLRIPFHVELVDLRTQRTMFGHHGVASVETNRQYFQFSGDPRARGREHETVPEGRRMVLSLESIQSLKQRAIQQMETLVMRELVEKVN